MAGTVVEQRQLNHSRGAKEASWLARDAATLDARIFAVQADVARSERVLCSRLLGVVITEEQI